VLRGYEGIREQGNKGTRLQGNKGMRVRDYKKIIYYNNLRAYYI